MLWYKAHSATSSRSTQVRKGQTRGVQGHISQLKHSIKLNCWTLSPCLVWYLYLFDIYLDTYPVTPRSGSGGTISCSWRPWSCWSRSFCSWRCATSAPTSPSTWITWTRTSSAKTSTSASPPARGSWGASPQRRTASRSRWDRSHSRREPGEDAPWGGGWVRWGSLHSCLLGCLCFVFVVSAWACALTSW